MIQLTVFLKDSGQFITPTLEEVKDYLTRKDVILWGRWIKPSMEEIDKLREIFHFHPLSLEDCRHQNQRAKLDQYENYVFLVLFAIRYKKNRLRIKELHLFLGENYLISVESQFIKVIDELWEKLPTTADTIKRGADFLLYTITDHVIDQLFPVIECLDDIIDELENKALITPRKPLLDQIFRVRRKLVFLRKTVGPMRDVFNKILNRDIHEVQEKHLIYFRDVYDHTVRIYEFLEMQRDLLSNTLDAYLSSASNNLNEVMKRLTIVSTIFLPLNFIVGLFGMNFEDLPFRNHLIFGLTLASFLLVPGFMLFWMKWKKWM
jgi:magnesium transporter